MPDSVNLNDTSNCILIRPTQIRNVIENSKLKYATELVTIDAEMDLSSETEYDYFIFHMLLNNVWRLNCAVQCEIVLDKLTAHNKLHLQIKNYSFILRFMLKL